MTLKLAIDQLKNLSLVIDLDLVCTTVTRQD